MNLIISNDKLIAIINSKGAELISLKKDDTEYIWEGNPEFWGKHSPILFPIVGTLKNNSFTYNNKEYPLSRHGFARDNEFEVYESSQDKIIFSLRSSEETLKNYPFKFELRISYILKDSSLEIKYEVFNENDSEMPFSIGGHPAFALPNEFENYSLKFDNDESIKSYFLKNDLLSNKSQDLDLDKNNLSLNYSLFKNDALIIKKMKSNFIDILENNIPILRFNFKDFPNFGIWTKEKAPFICLEPWFGYSDTLDSSGKILEKEGIIVLKDKDSFTASFSIEIY